MRTPPPVISLLALGLVLAGCHQSGTSASPTAPTSTAAATDTAAPATPAPSAASTAGMYGQFYGVQVSMGATTVTLQTTDVPDHPSPYFGSGSPMYEAPQAGMQVNPHHIEVQNITLMMPLEPQIASAPSDTPLGPIGVAVNGVVFFNQYAAGRQPLTFEIFSFDRQNGHPSPSNQYHYHIEPVWLTSASKSRLLGVLLDGFPVYGTLDATGQAPGDLDVCHGHVGATPEFPDGIYHYHVTAETPYIAGCYRGTRGSLG